MTAQPPSDARDTVRTTEREFVMERVFDAPRELVFRAFGACEHLRHWWGPLEWQLSLCQMDFRPGGTWLYCMRGPARPGGPEIESCGKTVYHEIVAPERIVYTDAFVDRDGTVQEGMPEVLSTLVFEDLGGRTRLITRGEYASEEALRQVLEMGIEEGLRQTYDRLEAYLSEPTRR